MSDKQTKRTIPTGLWLVTLLILAQVTLQQCPYGHYASGSVCLPCRANCRTCTSPTNCSACNDSYRLVSNVCLGCPHLTADYLKCKSCGSACSQAMPGYLLNTGTYVQTFTQCQAGCSQCTTATQCTTASSGFFVSGGIVGNCSANCLSCNSASNCTQCAQGYYWQVSISPFSCSGCPQANAQSCSGSNGTTLDSCKPGYWKNGSTCTACNSPNAELCNSGVTVACKSGYYLSGTDCLACGGNKASFDATTQAALVCNPGYSVQGIACVQDIICPSHQYTTEYNVCADCEFPTLRCSGSATNAHACQPGYVFSGNTCDSCGYGCLACSLQMSNGAVISL